MKLSTGLIITIAASLLQKAMAWPTGENNESGSSHDSSSSTANIVVPIVAGVVLVGVITALCISRSNSARTALANGLSKLGLSRCASCLMPRPTDMNEHAGLLERDLQQQQSL